MHSRKNSYDPDKNYRQNNSYDHGIKEFKVIDRGAKLDSFNQLGRSIHELPDAESVSDRMEIPSVKSRKNHATFEEPERSIIHDPYERNSNYDTHDRKGTKSEEKSSTRSMVRSENSKYDYNPPDPRSFPSQKAVRVSNPKPHRWAKRRDKSTISFQKHVMRVTKAHRSQQRMNRLRNRGR